MSKTLTKADLLLVTLALVQGPERFERGPALARILDEASKQHDLYREFSWNPDYEASKRLNEALNLLDLTGMVVGDNMPTRYFRLTGQARKNFSKKLESVPQAEREVIEQVARKLQAALGQGVA